MDKILQYEYGDHNSEVFTLVHPGSLTKVASSYSDELKDFITALTKRSGFTYALVNAMSAGEHYGSNRNGDYFPVKALKEYHKTFETNGHVYKHHINKDPKKSMGRVVFSHYNPSMNRVELILELSDEKAAPVIARLGKGELPAVSMGCKVPYDVCSICGNRAKTLHNYCSHLKDEMNKVYDDGRRVYAINTMPKFFDISVVTIPADTTAGFLSKVASAQPMLSAELGEDFNKAGDLIAQSEIKKKITAPADVVFSKDPDNLVSSSQRKLPESLMKELSKHAFADVLSSMLVMKMMPSRSDFQKLALYCSGHKEIADKLDKANIVFDADLEATANMADVSASNFNVKVAHILKEAVADLSLSKPLIISRAIEKVAYPFGDSGKDTNTKQREKQAPDLEALRALLEEYGLMPKGEPISEQEWDNWNKQLKHEPPSWRKFLFGSTEDPTFKPHKNPLGALAGIGAGYAGYAKLVSGPESTGVKAIVAKNPWIIPLIIGAGTIGSLTMQDSYFKKSASRSVMIPSLFVTVPLSYMMAGKAEADVRREKAISRTENFVRKHPFLTAVGMSGGLSTGMRLIKRAELLSQMDSGSLDEMYNQLIVN